MEYAHSLGRHTTSAQNLLAEMKCYKEQWVSLKKAVGYHTLVSERIRLALTQHEEEWLYFLPELESYTETADEISERLLGETTASTEFNTELANFRRRSNLTWERITNTPEDIGRLHHLADMNDHMCLMLKDHHTKTTTLITLISEHTRMSASFLSAFYTRLQEY